MQEERNGLILRNNTEKRWFEAELDGHRGQVEYMLVQNRIIYTHTEVDKALAGKGVASQLVNFALEYARQEELAIMPLCPFVAGYMKKNTSYNDLLAPGFTLG